MADQTIVVVCCRARERSRTRYRCLTLVRSSTGMWQRRSSVPGRSQSPTTVVSFTSSNCLDFRSSLSAPLSSLMFVNLFQRQPRRSETTQRLWAQRDPTTRTYKVSADVTRLRHFFTILKIPEELTESKSWFFCVLGWPKRIHTPRSTLEKKRRLRFTRTILRK